MVLQPMIASVNIVIRYDPARYDTLSMKGAIRRI